MKRMLLGTAAGLLAAVLFIPGPALAQSAASGAVLDSVGQNLVWGRAPDRRALPASTTKIMTGLLVCERCNPLEPVKIPREAVGIEGSSMYLQEGEVLTVQELLYGLMLRSGNDAATALAIHCGGTQENFVRMMNDRAQALGLANTHFENPHGLDGKSHYLSARDLGILGLTAMKNPIFARTVGTRTSRCGDRILQNHNKLLWRMPGAEGIKTGYTRRAGRVLVSSCTRDGRRMVAVTMDDPQDWKDHQAMMDRAFREICPRCLIRKGQQVGLLEVQGGEKNQVRILAGEDFTFGARKEEKTSVVIPGPGFVYAPAVRGADAGCGWVLIGGTPVGRIPLEYGNTVEIPREKPGPLRRIFGG